MKKYAIITDGKTEELKNVLNLAGFNVSRVPESAWVIYLNIENNKGHASWDEEHYFSSTISKYEIRSILTPSDVLYGRAFDLDGAKKPEPRYFLATHLIRRSDAKTDVVKCVRGEDGRWMHLFAHTNDQRLELEYLERNDSYIEISADAVDYIRDNAEKAKGMGYEFQEWKSGYSLITGIGEIGHGLRAINPTFCAGHRYCRKPEPLQEETNQFCHNCSEEVKPVDSNFCRHCGAKLIK